MYRKCTTYTLHNEPDLNQQEFYCVLAEELIDNNIQRRRGTRRSQQDPQNMRSASHDTMNLKPELRATRAKKRHKNGTMTKFCKQWRCSTPVIHQPCIHAIHPKDGGSYAFIPRFRLHFSFDLDSILSMTIMLVNF